MRVFYFLLLIVFLPCIGKGQTNLVPNPSFEDTTNCIGFLTFNTSYPWYTPTISTPDYYYGLNPACGNSALNNPSGYQYPHSGIAYIGMYLQDGNTREYISEELNDTLISGHHYSVSFYTSRANLFSYSTDKLGMYISTSKITSSGFGFLPYSPQIINPPGNFLNDTLNWISIAGIYTAIGGEKYITIGNFADSANTPVLDLDNSPDTYNSAYYYIDDVSMIDLDSLQSIAENKDCGEIIKIAPNPVHGLNSLKINVSKCKTIKYINIYDLSGKKCISETYDETLKGLSNNLPNGIYFLEAITNQNENIRVKLIII